MIEHVVLFNVKDDADPGAVKAWIDGLISLSSLDEVLHLTAGPVLRTRPVLDDVDEDVVADGNHLRFTHMLHARYDSLSRLHSYSAHPAHQQVVTELGQPITDDIMAVDWIVSESDTRNSTVGPPHPGPGRALRLTCFKIGEGEGKGKKAVEELLEGLKRVQGECSGLFEEMSFGEEVSVDRAKGYSVAALVRFSDLNELDACEEYEDAMRKVINKARSAIDGIVAVDYLVPRAGN